MSRGVATSSSAAPSLAYSRVPCTALSLCVLVVAKHTTWKYDESTPPDHWLGFGLLVVHHRITLTRRPPFATLVTYFSATRSLLLSRCGVIMFAIGCTTVSGPHPWSSLLELPIGASRLFWSFPFWSSFGGYAGCQYGCRTLLNLNTCTAAFARDYTD